MGFRILSERGDTKSSVKGQKRSNWKRVLGWKGKGSQEERSGKPGTEEGKGGVDSMQ